MILKSKNGKERVYKIGQNDTLIITNINDRLEVKSSLEKDYGKDFNDKFNDPLEDLFKTFGEIFSPTKQ